MSIFPSHSNRTNERRERRRNWKAEMRRAAETDKPAISRETAIRKFDKLAAALVAAGAVEKSNGRYKVRVGNGKRFYPVYQIKGLFRCACADDERHGTCAHARAAELFAAKREVAEERFTARLEYGNRKGLDFSKEAKFATRQAAAEWLVNQAFDKFQPTGSVTDAFGETVFEITDEFFELWAEEVSA